MSSRRTSKSLSGKRPKSLSPRQTSKLLSEKRPHSEPKNFKPISFEIPQPTDAPKDIEPVVDNIQDTLDKLSQIGREKGAVHYRGNINMAEVAYVAIINKFKHKCIPRTFRVKLHLIINSDPEETPILNDNDTLIYFGESLKECIDNGVPIICIFLILKFGNTKSVHANILIYRPFERIIERFEPHGRKYFNSLKVDMSINKQLKELFEDKMNTYTNGKVRFYPPSKICPYKKGFQALEEDIKGLQIEGGGFCVMWSLFIMEMIMNNPEIKTKDIIDKVMDITNKDPKFLKDTIRGYVVSIEQLLDNTFKRIEERGFSFEKMGFSKYSKYSNKMISFILNSIIETSQGTSQEMSYKSLPNSVEMDLFDKLILLSREQLKKLTLKKRLPLFIKNDKYPIEDIVDNIIKLYDEDIIEQFLPEVMMDLSK